MLHVTSNNKRDIRLKCPLIFNLVFSIITTIEIKHAEERKAAGAQLFTIRTKTLLYKGLNRLQKYDLADLIRRIQNEDETYVHSRKLAGKHFNKPMDLG